MEQGHSELCESSPVRKQCRICRKRYYRDIMRRKREREKKTAILTRGAVLKKKKVLLPLL